MPCLRMSKFDGVHPIGLRESGSPTTKDAAISGSTMADIVRTAARPWALTEWEDRVIARVALTATYMSLSTTIHFVARTLHKLHRH
ncbi:hypothetical protein TNCV_4881081 [Trichonephila clavipes]|nr:hypothetical protein TNCV_4881081 [Trichonephila clavipes]